jgi:hypothetical protein
MKMKKMLIICMIVSFKGFSQEWFPIDAIWHYTLPGIEKQDYVRITVSGQALDTDPSCKELVFSRGSDGIQWTETICHSGDSVFYVNNEKKYLLYNFNAKKGDTVVVHKELFNPTKSFFHQEGLGSFSYEIIEIDTITLNGKNLQRQTVRRLRESDWGFEGLNSVSYIIESIGSLSYFFGLSNNGYPEQVVPLLRCYSGNGIKYKSESWAHECDYTNSGTEKCSDFFNVSQDPTYLYLRSCEIINSVNITTINGLSLYGADFGKYDIHIPKLGLPNGVLIITVKRQNGQLISSPLIIEL